MLKELVQRGARKVLAMTGDYQGASQGRRLLFWNPGNASINALVAGSGEALRNRSRDLVRQDSWASESVEEWVANAVGNGITPKFRHPDLNVQKILSESWKRWTDQADADGNNDFYGLQTLNCREVIEAGESLARMRPRFASDRFHVPLQIQMLEAEHLPFWKSEPTAYGNVVRAGIEFNQIGQRINYHLYKEHPGAGHMGLTANQFEITAVPARFVTHTYRVTRSGQYRGEPWMTRALARLYNLGQFDDATLERQKLGAMMLGWIKSITPNQQFAPSENLPNNAGTAPEGTKFGSIEPGTIMQLNPDEELDFFKNPDIGTQSEAFVKSQLRAAFAATGLSLEQFDASVTSYSSIRAVLLKFRRRCEQFQFQTLVFQFCRPIASAWMDALVLSGNSGINAADYAKNRHLYQMIEWRTPKWAWVDPMKDALAEIALVRAGFKTRSQVIQEEGYDPDEVADEYKRDNERADKDSAVYDSDPRKTTKAGGAAVAPGAGSPAASLIHAAESAMVREALGAEEHDTTDD